MTPGQNNFQGTRFHLVQWTRETDIHGRKKRKRGSRLLSHWLQAPGFSQGVKFEPYRTHLFSLWELPDFSTTRMVVPTFKGHSLCSKQASFVHKFPPLPIQNTYYSKC